MPRRSLFTQEKSINRSTKAQSQTSAPPELQNLLSWMQEVIVHPDGVLDGIRSANAQQLIAMDPEQLDCVVAPSKNLSSEERISIYANMYYWRMLESMEQDYEGVRTALGEETFGEYVKIYLQQYPSRSYNLAHFGQHFPEFLKNELGDFAHRKLIVDLAILERTIEEVRDAAEDRAITMDALLQIPQECWSEVRFSFIRAFRLLALKYPANAYLQTVIDKKPESCAGFARKKSNYIMVFRVNFRTWRTELPRSQYILLNALQQGASLGMAVEKVMGVVRSNRDEIVSNIGAWFKSWAADGIFTHVKLGQASL